MKLKRFSEETGEVLNSSKNKLTGKEHWGQEARGGIWRERGTETEGQRETETDKQEDRQTETDTERHCTERETERGTDRQTETDRDRQTDRDRVRETDTETDTETDRQTQRENSSSQVCFTILSLLKSPPCLMLPFSCNFLQPPS